MEAIKPVTSRRIIKPSGSADVRLPDAAPRARPPVAAPSAALIPIPAAQAAAAPAANPMWRSWVARFQEIERTLIPAEARERNGWSNAPRLPNPSEVQRVQERFLSPWLGLIETFTIAVIASPLSAAQRSALQSYLDRRAAYYRCVMKRFLVPSDLAIRQLGEAQARLDATPVTWR